MNVFSNILNGHLSLKLMIWLFFVQINVEKCSDGLPYLRGLRVDSEEIAGYNDGVVAIPPDTDMSVRL